MTFSMPLYWRSETLMRDPASLSGRPNHAWTGRL